LGYENQAVHAVDINPNKINLKRNAKMVTVFIELPDGYNVADIDISTIKLEKAIYAEAHPFSLGDYDNDNIPDLMVKFDARALSEYLDGTIGEVILSINGEFYDGSLFEGNDIITFF
jgi:hypothetical protein